MPPAKPSNVFKNGLSSSSSSSSSKSSNKPSASTPSSLHKTPPARTTSFQSPSTTAANDKSANDDGGGDDDDYMSLTFSDPSFSSSSIYSSSAPKHETSIQRIARLKREAEARGRPKSKAELAAEEKRKRDEALATDLTASGGKGLSMMQKMGFKIGGGLGHRNDGDGRDDLEKRLTEPLVPVIKETRSGVGHDTHVKRKLAETFDGDPLQSDAKKGKIESDDDYRSRLHAENQARRQEGQYYGCQKVCERLSAEDDEAKEDGGRKRNKNGLELIRNTPVVWRGLLWHRARRELDAKIRHDVMSSGVSRVAEVNGYTVDPEMDNDDKTALAVEEEVALEDEWEDKELEEFEAKEPGEKLAEILNYMRQTWKYCFWCKSRYPDDAMEGCPGTNEDDHD